MDKKTLAIYCYLIFGVLLLAYTEAKPAANHLFTGSDFGKPVNSFPATQLTGRKGRQYYGYPGGYGGYPGYGYGGFPGGFGGSHASASASASSSSFGGFGK